MKKFEEELIFQKIRAKPKKGFVRKKQAFKMERNAMRKVKQQQVQRWT